jgi:hypothetical protein
VNNIAHEKYKIKDVVCNFSKKFDSLISMKKFFKYCDLPKLTEDEGKSE